MPMLRLMRTSGIATVTWRIPLVSKGASTGPRPCHKSGRSVGLRVSKKTHIREMRGPVRGAVTVGGDFWMLRSAIHPLNPRARSAMTLGTRVWFCGQ
jgi:hypothetical protein